MWQLAEMSLAACSTGDEADVVCVEADSAVASRLREFGLTAGARVRVNQSGSPMILEIGGARVCLRAEELDGVLVQVALAAPTGVNTVQEVREPA